MRQDVKLSDHCLVDHQQATEGVPQEPVTALSVLRNSLLMVDRLMHFTGVRGTVWRLLGVTRSSKNPNICNI